MTDKEMAREDVRDILTEYDAAVRREERERCATHLDRRAEDVGAGSALAAELRSRAAAIRAWAT